MGFSFPLARSLAPLLSVCDVEGRNKNAGAELAQIKLEEETRESDLTLLSHLDRKLGSLKQEQTDLIEASYDVKVRKENLDYTVIVL